MKADRDRLMREGFLVLREVIPPDALADMRRSHEALVERQGGDQWLSQGAQPRLRSGPLIDGSTANAVEAWTSDSTLGVAQQLLCSPEAGVTEMWCMCSPLTDHGPAGWHRDVHPVDMAPMHLLQQDMLANGPRYLQWNIPLYDDSVLWVVPGSHRRLNTHDENASLSENGRVPLPNSIPVELNAGDGVIYINFILHWGSDYSSKMRRTLHGGHSIFTRLDDLSFTRFLSPRAREMFQQFGEQTVLKQDATEAALRAVIDRDADTYVSALETLQPHVDDSGKLVLTIYLSKSAWHMWALHRPEDKSIPQAVRGRAGATHSITLNWGPEFAGRFTHDESALLWQRFGPLDRQLRSDREQYVPGYQSGKMFYYFETALEGYGLPDFVASWDG